MWLKLLKDITSIKWKSIALIDKPHELSLYSTPASNAICEILKGQTAVDPSSCHRQSVLHAPWMS